MARSAGFSQQMTDLLGRYRLALQGVGVVLAGAGFGAAWRMAPTNLAAQLSAPLAGLALVLFAQFFFIVGKLKPEERGALGVAGLACFALCLAASLGATGYHWAKNSSINPMGGGSGGGAITGGGAAGTEVSFASDEPNRLVIHAPGTNWRRVVVEVQEIWTLSPDTPGPETIDWPATVPLELSPEQKTPYKESQLSGGKMPVEIVLKPAFADLPPDATQLEGGRVIIKFTNTKKPKDHVYLLHLELQDARGRPINVGSVLYMPDLGTGYNTPTTEANREVLSKLAALPMPRSAKLARLLSGAPPAAEKKSPSKT